MMTPKGGGENESMEVTVPHYYRKFRCIASECPDTCCAGWEIVIDKKTLKKYRKIKGPFGSRIHNSVNWKEHSFRQYKGKCAFLNEENLCDLYLEGGKEYFCRTCRRYPRHVEEFEDCREISLSLSCMAAARLILDSTEKVRFLHADIPQIPAENYRSFDYFLFSSLLDVRKLMIEILQNRSMDAGIRTGMALALVHDFQERADRGRLGETEELLERYRRPSAGRWFEKKLYTFREKDRQNASLRLFRMLGAMEALKEDWPDQIQKAHHILYRPDKEEYLRMRRDWKAGCAAAGLDRALLQEQLMVYYVFTYFAGAVYDGNAFGKAKMAVWAAVLTEELAMARAIAGGRPSKEDFLWTAHLLSKEMEHSDQNLNLLEKLLEPVELEEFFHLLA